MKAKKLLFSIVGGLALPIATLSTLVGCTHSGSQPTPYQEMPKVVFDYDQIIKRVTVSNEMKVTMTGLCSAGIDPEELDDTVRTTIISCSDKDISPNLSAKIAGRNQRWITIEVTCTKVSKPCVIYYKMSFINKNTGVFYEADTSFVLYPVDISEEIDDSKVVKVKTDIESVSNRTCSVLIEGFSVNGGNEGLYIDSCEIIDTTPIDINDGKLSVVKGDGGSFSVRLEFKNIPTSGGNIQFKLHFKDTTNPAWEGQDVEGFNFTFKAPNAYIITGPSADYMKETSWTTIGDDDGAKNDINCLFSGFTIDPENKVSGVVISANTKGKWQAEIINNGDYFDVYVYGQNVSLTSTEITLDITFSIKTPSSETTIPETHSGFTINVDSTFSLSANGGVYCYKVWNQSDPKTMKLSYSSAEIQSKMSLVGYVLYAKQTVDPNKQVVIHVVEEPDEFFPGPLWKKGIYDRTYFANQTEDIDKGMSVEMLNTNYVSEVWSRPSTEEVGIYSIYTD